MRSEGECCAVCSCCPSKKFLCNENNSTSSADTASQRRIQVWFFLLLACTCTRTCTPHTQLTGNQANCRVEWCVVIFDRHDYPAELVRKRSVIKLGEHTHRKASVQSGLGAIGWRAGCVLSQLPCLTEQQLPSSVVQFSLNNNLMESIKQAQKNNRAPVLMVD